MSVFDTKMKIQEVTLGLAFLKGYVSAFGWDPHAFNYVNALTKTAVESHYLPHALVEMSAEAFRESQKRLKPKAESEHTQRFQLETKEEKPSKPKETTEPDLYLFPEQAYNMTGWGNLNYGTSRY